MQTMLFASAEDALILYINGIPRNNEHCPALASVTGLTLWFWNMPREMFDCSDASSTY